MNHSHSFFESVMVRYTERDKQQSGQNKKTYKNKAVSEALTGHERAKESS